MSSPQEFNCIFCKETFGNKEDLQIHFRKHGDPKFNQSQKGKSRPQSEAQTSVEKKGEEVELVSCDVCPETFPTISKAITHKHKVHPDHDAKYFCPWCGKLFTMKHLYNKHLKSNHMNLARSDETNFHCDACDVDFYVPSAMVYHNKFFHRQDTDLPTIGQSKKLKMCQQEVLQIYYCAFCGDEYDNKVNLHKHMTDDHGDENQSPEDVLRCPLCEAIFYHLDAYEVHLTFHSTDDLYSEKNEMFEEIEEFSLETVPPIVEKVENVEPQEDAETAMNAVGIDKFLEMAMDESLEKDGDGLKSKLKKHKKHKKKKKEAITLDEFLNMNKDVFGEGLDFQGIEEVPTQVVAKRLKQKKIGKPVSNNLKVAQSCELEKLKKQGIVVKMKSTRKPSAQHFKLGNKIVTNPLQSVNKISTNVQSPDEVLSKLINQSNSQIKIVKKSSQDNSEFIQQDREDDTHGNTTLEKRSASPENIEVECDVNMPSEYASSENEGKEDNTNNIDRNFDNDQEARSNTNINQEVNKSQDNLESPKEQENPDNDKDSIKNNTDDIHKDKTDEILHSDKNIKELNPTNPLKNSAGITIKPVTHHSVQHSVKTSEDKNMSDEKDDLEHEHGDENEEIEPDTSTNDSLIALKHLSHLITVKSVIPKRSSTPDSTFQAEVGLKEPKLSKTQEDSDVYDEKQPTDMPKELPQSQAQVIKEKALNSFGSLKNLSKNITIKPVTQSPKQPTDKSDDDHDDDDDDVNNIIKNVEKSVLSTQTAKKLATPIKSSENNLPSPKGPNILKSGKPTNTKEISMEKQSNMNLLKHLTNVTAKPVNAVRSNIPVTNNTSNKQNISKPSVTQTSIKKQEINEEIEIFNIDDSDDEPDNEVAPPLNKTSSPQPTLPENKSNKSFDTLKNISKHITVKPVNQQATQMNRTSVKQTNPEERAHSENRCSMSDFSDDDDDQNTLIPTNFNTVQHKLKLQNDNLKSTLKNLGKHITVKSGNPSPNASIKSGKDHNSRDNFEMDEGADSDDSYSGKVKITEMTDDDKGMSDEDVEQSNKNKNNDYDGNISVKSPQETNSDHDNIDAAEDEDFSDLEYQIKANTVKKKPSQTINTIVNLKNMNKNLTIKSLADKKAQGTKDVECNSKNVLPITNNALSIKPFKQVKTESNSGEEKFTNKKSIMNAAQVKRSIINQNQSMNQSIASSHQQNTVNKEVTVKTIQTKTVIQEITTTVTKTIKTVNQTVKQEVQNTSQNNLMKFQKVQGMKASNQQIKNFQGVTVRHATPVAGTKIRGGAPQNIGGNIRPSNQLVPVRPARNTARMSVPRMPAVKRNVAPGSMSQSRPAVGKPLKISPNAVSSTKRPTDEPVAHFSCFKKPKESLIPFPDIPSFANEQGSESVVQFSASQTSRSNFSSATKTVKGNTIVTQMKSEVSSSSQHLEKLNSVSGLKVVKTSQNKQAMKVEEKCEMSPSKRNTLEAIEKLQKQGLLVKKPRLEDVSNESDHSDEGNDYITEEPDD